MAKDGFNIIANYSGNVVSAEETIHAIISNGGTAVAIQVDVANDTEVSQLFKKTKFLNGKIDVIVHSAGIMPLTKISTTGLADFDKVINTNLRGTFLVHANAAENISDSGHIAALSTTV